MIKLVCFLRRKPGMSVEAFHEHWRERHGPLIAGTPGLAKYLVRYEQNHRLAADRARDDADAPGFDGATVQWLESKEAFLDFVRAPEYPELIAPDEARFLDRSSLVVFFTEEAEPKIDGDPSGAACKLLALLRRRPGDDAEHFHRHWRDPHAGLFRDTPEIARHILAYHQNHTLPDEDAPLPGAWDGLAEVWFEGVDAFEAMVREPRYLEQVPADEEHFVDRSAIQYILAGPPEVIIG